MSVPPTSTSALSGSRVTPLARVRADDGLWTKAFLRLVGVQAAFGYAIATFNLLPKHWRPICTARRPRSAW